MLKWQKKYYKVRDHKQYKRCKECGKLIEKTSNKKMYCDDCKRKMELQRYKKYNEKRNNHK